ncbi:MAG: tRNA pseudouridine(13) synthase TruD [Planctomycetes bacterium RBG_13_62_9]|nr:MAG: tRNA pseudouridine(13) synthase TruD [Planctomycetes bacterium RBG_13_62_9]
MPDSLPFLTAAIPGVGGVIKTRPEDFVVEELPLYQPGGAGTHVYALMEKRGIGTREALDRVARALNFSRREIGSAGLKDAQAVTRQWISIEHVEAQQLERISVPDVRILQTSRHTNKLKPGHLRGNRFAIRLRKLVLPLPQATEMAQEVLSILSRRGVPNYFGPQRFGNHQDNHLLGKAVARNDAVAFTDQFLGHPREIVDSPPVFEARRLYQEGRYEEAAKAWPGQFFDHRRALRVLAKSSGNKKRVFYTIDKHLKGLFISAYQSDLFNRVLAARMPDIDRLLLGDMAYKHDNGACFRVEDPVAEQPRCDRFEISPTGPLLGGRMTRLTASAGEIENPVLDGETLNEQDFRQMRHLGARGGRRPLRFQPRDVRVSSGQDDLGPYLELAFELDAGCYATTLLAEITKDRPAEAAEPDAQD